MPLTSRLQTMLRSRIGKAAVVGALALPLAMTGLATANAQPTSGGTAAQPTPTLGADFWRNYHPERDYLGSTVAAHEGAQQGSYQPKIQAGTPGIDISHFQGGINWGSVAGSNRFVYIKATDGTGYRDPNFSANYTGSYNARMIRGAYHFGRPNMSNGVTQADYFVQHGGGWSRDNQTLPPMLDIEYNPSGATCYGLSTTSMSWWIADFSNEVHRLTSRYPVIYTTTNWWNQCTGSNPNFAGANPLFVARYNSTVGALPAGWGFYTIWQYSASGRTPGISGNVDSDTFNGAQDRLLALANG